MNITQGLHRGALLKGRQTALICAGQSLSWSAFADRAARLAGALVNLGLRPGDRVALLAESGFHYFEYQYGVPWAGGVIVPLNVRLSDRELGYILCDSDVTIAIVGSEYAGRVPALRAEAPQLRTVVTIGTGDGTGEYGSLLGASEPLPDCYRGGDDLLAIVYTGGTTGRPKGVALSHDNLMINALAAIPVLGFSEDTVYLHAAPLFHSSGCARVYGTVTALARGVIVPRFDEFAVLQTVASQGITDLILMPTMCNRVLNCPIFDQTDLSSIKTISYGAAIMPEALLRQALDRLPHVDFIQCYGMTELSPFAAALPAKYHVLDGPYAGKLKSCGQPIYTAEIRIADGEDRELAHGEIGEIQVRGPMVMQGYWKQPEATAAALRGGWMHTGDAGYMDEEGFVFLVDRIKDMIISGGENIYCGEVENAIYEHSGVRECAVIGVADDKWGESVHAIVVPHDRVTLTEADIIAHCREWIAGYKCPRSVDIRCEPLPLSGTGKILKTELRAERP